MLHPGLNEQVINNQLDTELSAVAEARKSTAPIDKAEASKVLSQYLSEVIEGGLDNVRDNGGRKSWGDEILDYGQDRISSEPFHSLKNAESKTSNFSRPTSRGLFRGLFMYSYFQVLEITQQMSSKICK